MIRYAKLPDGLINTSVEQLNPIELEDKTIFYGLKFTPVKEIENPNYNQGQKNSTGSEINKTIMVKDDSKNVYYDEITQKIMDKESQDKVIQDVQDGKYTKNMDFSNVVVELAKQKQFNANLIVQIAQLKNQQTGGNTNV
ncbi:hypothetical protein DY123_07280 [Apilactobacillus micheneri]|uniref:hypothetical protein n=1 Tax=Apilactobacillus micheneri TaxID=1899430 RepID=UPI001127D3C7|nr:hypothetical protein [Apilactobacillus micheneri]TPR41283.1 hypothetical protein DY123_07280 [Apilactobacillus micheneri]